jgi:hypothetical protein
MKKTKPIRKQKVIYKLQEEKISTGCGPEGPSADYLGTWTPPAPYGRKKHTDNGEINRSHI